MVGRREWVCRKGRQQGLGCELTQERYVWVSEIRKDNDHRVKDRKEQEEV